MSSKSRFLLSCVPALLLASAETLTAATPVFSITVDPSGTSVSIRLRHDEAVRGGNIGFVLDPGVFTIKRVIRGSSLPDNPSLFSTLFDGELEPDGSIQVSDPVTPVDGATGEPVPGGALLGWINSFQGDVVLDPGDHEIFVLEIEPAADATPGTRGNFEFRDGLRVPPGPPQNTIVTNADALTVAAAGEGGTLCVPPRMILTPGPVGGQETAPLNVPLSVEGLDAPLAWSGTGLPQGLELDTDGGTASIAGVPMLNTAGDYDVTLEVCGACGGGTLCVEEVLTLDIVPPPAVVSIAPTADQILIDGGARAIAFAGSVTAPPGSDVVLDAATFENIGGANAAERITGCSIAIDDGDGVFTMLDRVLPPSGSFDPIDQTVTLDGLGESFGPGETLTFFFICDLAGSSVGAVAGPGGAPFHARLPEGPMPLVALLAAAMMLLALAVFPRLRSRAALAVTAPLVLAVAVAAGCSSGGDDGADRLQMRLTGLEMFRTPSGESVPVDGVPSTGRAF